MRTARAACCNGACSRVTAQEPEYRELIDQYLERGEFRTLVKDVASGLGLLVLDAGDLGIVLGPAGESAFAFRPAEFRPSASADDRLLDGLAQLAIAATIFPASRDLEDEATRARLPVTIDEIESNMRRLCKRIEEENQQAPDPMASEDEAGFYEAWRVYQSRLAAAETSDNRQSRRHAAHRPGWPGTSVRLWLFSQGEPRIPGVLPANLALSSTGEGTGGASRL